MVPFGAGRKGHLSQRAVGLDRDEDLLTLVRYIHLNPVRAVLAEALADFAPAIGSIILALRAITSDRLGERINC